MGAIILHSTISKQLVPNIHVWRFCEPHRTQSQDKYHDR